MKHNDATTLSPGSNEEGAAYWTDELQPYRPLPVFE